MKKPSKNLILGITDHDTTLFRAAVGEVQPIHNPHKIIHNPIKRIPKVRSMDTPIIPDTLSDFMSADSPNEYLKNGVSRLTLRKIGQGPLAIMGKLDLHGHYIDEARKQLQYFLQEAALHELRCVIVIHGKGLNSKDGESILRNLTRHWLTQHPHVLAYCEAKPAQGGSGATLVLLKVSSLNSVNSP